MTDREAETAAATFDCAVDLILSAFPHANVASVRGAVARTMHDHGNDPEWRQTFLDTLSGRTAAALKWRLLNEELL